MISTGLWTLAQNPVLPDSAKPYRSPIDMEILLAGNFGELRNNHFHAGLDFKTQGSINHPVYSFADGYVCRVGISPLGYGLAVYVRHPQMGLTSVYGHLNSFSDRIYQKVRERQIAREENNISVSFGPDELPVKMGDTIALSGNTGSSGGPHVHFELRDCNDEDDTFYNPAPFFNDKIADHRAPRASNIYFYPKGGVVSGQRVRQSAAVIVAQSGQRTINRVVTAWGRIGLGLKAFDYVENQGNTFGIYHVQLYCDDRLIYQFKADSFRFSERRYSNALTDFRGWINNRLMIHKNFIEPGNQLQMVDHSLGDGTVVIDEERPYHFRYVLSDAHGNKSEVEFKVKGKKSVLPPDPWAGVKSGTFVGKGILMRYNESAFFDSLGCQVKMPAGSLYSDAEVPFRCTAPTDPQHPCVSDIYAVGHLSIPLHKSFELTIPIPRGYADTLSQPQQLYVVNLDGGYVGGKYHQGAMHVLTSEFGRFAVRRDTFKPTATIVSMTWNKAQISVADKGSGVARYKVFIDGHFVPFDLNRYGRRYGQPRYYGVERNKMHDVKIWVKDYCGNENTIEMKKFF